MRYLLLLGVTLLSACSSTPQSYTEAGYPYCYVDETHVTVDGKTSSAQVTECTDRPGKQAQILRAGIESSCEEFWYSEMRYGRRFPVRGVRCEKLDGSWEILDLNGSVR